jgi:hypothetical protein
MHAVRFTLVAPEEQLETDLGGGRGRVTVQADKQAGVQGRKKEG